MFKTLGFLEKEMFFCEKTLENFQKHLTRILFLEGLSKVIITYAISKRPKFDFFFEKMTFFRNNPWKISEALFGIFYRECVWHFHIASEFSKQLNFCVFGEIDIVFEKILFFSKIGKRGIFLLACVSKSIIAQEIWKSSTAWDFR